MKSQQDRLWAQLDHMDKAMAHKLDGRAWFAGASIGAACFAAVVVYVNADASVVNKLGIAALMFVCGFILPPVWLVGLAVAFIRQSHWQKEARLLRDASGRGWNNTEAFPRRTRYRAPNMWVRD